MDSQYSGKVVVITASSTGIGFGMARMYARHGANVIVSSRNQKNIDQAVAEINSEPGLKGKAHGIKCHAANKEDRTRLLGLVKEKFGGIDVLIPNAAVSTTFGSTMMTTEEQFDKTIEVNLKAVFFLIKEAMPLMVGRPGANILLISSYAAYDPEPNIGIYSMTKTALLGLTKVLAKELADENMRVNCIAPGLIKTKFSKGLWEGREEMVLEKLRVNRLGEIDDIASTALFLTSKGADYINGEILGVYGFVLPKL